MMHGPAGGIRSIFWILQTCSKWKRKEKIGIKFNTRNLLLFLSSLTFLLQKTVSSFSCDVSCRCLVMTLIINGSLIHWLLTRLITRVIVLMKGEILTCYKCTIACLFFQVFPSLCFSLFVFCFFFILDRPFRCFMMTLMINGLLIHWFPWLITQVIVLIREEMLEMFNVAVFSPLFLSQKLMVSILQTYNCSSTFVLIFPLFLPRNFMWSHLRIDKQGFVFLSCGL